jgi:Tfp pilus assembly protein PilF
MMVRTISFFVLALTISLPVFPQAIRFSNDQSDTKDLFLTGRVVDPGSAQLGDIQVQLRCDGQTRGQTSTDSHGNFEIHLSGPSENLRVNMLQSGLADSSGSMREPLLLSQCELVAHNGQFASSRLELGSPDQQEGTVNVGTLIINRPSLPGAATISVDTLKANPRARELFEKALVDEQKGRIEDARAHLQKALDSDSGFRDAWFVLAELNFRQGRWDEARSGYLNALKADGSFAPANVGLAQVALQTRQWTALEHYSSLLLGSTAADQAWVWLVNGLAKLELGLVPDAQQSAIAGLRLDSAHRFPQLEYILGLALARQHVYGSALQHLENYARLAQGKISPLVESQLAQVRGLAGQSASAP